MGYHGIHPSCNWDSIAYSLQGTVSCLLYELTEKITGTKTRGTLLFGMIQIDDGLYHQPGNVFICASDFVADTALLRHTSLIMFAVWKAESPLSKQKMNGTILYIVISFH